jgi:hypothetical protein
LLGALSHHQCYDWNVDVSRAAARARLELRKAGFLEFEPGRRGFVVEGDPNGGWVIVTCVTGLHGGSTKRDHDLRAYRDILSAAGFEVTDSPWVPGSLRVTLPPNAGDV